MMGGGAAEKPEKRARPRSAPVYQHLPGLQAGLSGL